MTTLTDRQRIFLNELLNCGMDLNGFRHHILAILDIGWYSTRSKVRLNELRKQYIIWKHFMEMVPGTNEPERSYI